MGKHSTSLCSLKGRLLELLSAKENKLELAPEEVKVLAELTVFSPLTVSIVLIVDWKAYCCRSSLAKLSMQASTCGSADVGGVQSLLM